MATRESNLKPDWDNLQPQVREALRQLKAQSHTAGDGLGFDRFDADRSVRLIALERWLGDNLRQSALLLKRYRRQLNDHTLLAIFGSCDLDEVKSAEVPPALDFSPAAIAEEISAEEYFGKGQSDQLFIYKNGCYRANAEGHVRGRVKSLLRDRDVAKEWSSRLANEVVEYLRVDAPELWARPRLDVVNVLNGLLDVKSRKLMEHSPECLSPIQIPVSFDPDAKCPAWCKFVEDVFPAGKGKDLAFEIAGDLIVPDRSIQKAVLLFGEGGNGKSVFLEGLRAFIGPVNVSSVSLQDLSKNRFAKSVLLGKLANIYPDLPARHLTDSADFKSIVGGDEIFGEQKYKKPFSFKPFVRLVFSSNHLPYSSDASEAFFDRFIVVPFDRSFRGHRSEVSREELDRRLADPRELSGLLNLALDALDRLRVSRRFTEVAATKKALKEYKEVADPLRTWLDENLISDEGAETPAKDVRDAYNREAVKAGRSALSDSQFGKRFSAIRPKIVKSKRGTHGNRAWCYLDVALEAEPRR